MNVTKTVTVEAARDIAFRVFTQKMTSWWPEGHHIGKTALVEVVVEPRVSGRWFERCVDGSECEWGRVLAWEPPNRIVLAWQLNADFVFDKTFETEVEVRFIEEAASRTRVELEHRHLERFGAREAEMVAAFSSQGGWERGLAAFAAATRAAGAVISAKRGFFLRLIPPRPTFSTDMNDRERRAMNEHVAYWMGLAARGTVVAFGLAADPAGGYGVGIVEVDDEADVRKISAEDPAIRGEIGLRYEVIPMARLVTRA